jgi:hypothetical protein
MTEKAILQWIKGNLGMPIKVAIAGTVYTEDWLGAMACREVGVLIPGQPTVPDWSLFKGDYTQRPGEEAKQYHGFSPWQIDTGSFPLWINAGNWKEPFKSAVMAVAVLEGKRKYITTHTKLTGDALDRANTAAYNCGEGNVVKTVARNIDIDSFTANHNYSADVWRLRGIYKTL